MKKDYLTIAVAKGYLLEESLSLLSKIGYDFQIESIKDSRKLYYFDKDHQIRILNIRPWDVTVYVEQGAADLGIVGKDVLLEKNDDVVELVDLKFGKCKLVLAGLEEKNSEIIPNLTVATKYPNSTERYFNQLNIKPQILKMYGAIELAPLTGLADYIVDLTATGQTLKENHLKILDTVFSSSARLVANKIRFRINYLKIRELINKIKDQQNSLC